MKQSKPSEEEILKNIAAIKADPAQFLAEVLGMISGLGVMVESYPGMVKPSEMLILLVKIISHRVGSGTMVYDHLVNPYMGAEEYENLHARMKAAVNDIAEGTGMDLEALRQKLDELKSKEMIKQEEEEEEEVVN